MYAVIMAGGKGERLWPKSTKGRAKHILTFGTRNVMIQETLKRLRQKLPVDHIFLVTTKKQYSSLKPYLSVIKKSNIILEPEGRDTAAAICLASLIIKKRFGSVTMAVLPADHVIKDVRLLFRDLEAAGKLASSGPNMVTIGIKPKYPSVGYGYLEIGKKYDGHYALKRFIEKPGRKKAESFYRQKNFLWNSGIFVWSADTVLAELKRHLPNLYYALKDTTGLAGKKGYFIKLSGEYARIKPVSIDYGIMEPIARSKSHKIYCVMASFDWVDIGSWSSVEEIYDKDKNGNILLSDSTLIDVKNSTIISDRGHKIGAIGVKDIIIVQTKSGTLVCAKSRAQEVKDLVRSF
ncbi:MAG: NTP transferase domain-containing protein [Candidatus Omnitrophica bacterium]|nr:NTP transferase domain-containing protein [Candidatus Omnitrophota bacterium]MBU1932779.1 NTP transferase domain-containing protein [Candidatus Omnitrophota bacterium]